MPKPMTGTRVWDRVAVDIAFDTLSVGCSGYHQTIMQAKLTVGLRTMAMRVQLKGIASATKQLADGSMVKYFYAWRGGPPLTGRPGTPDFIKSYNEAVAKRRTQSAATLNKAIDTFLSSTEFTKDLAPRSRAEYQRFIKHIRAKFGSMPLSAVEDKRARGLFKGWRDELAEKSLRQADYAWVTLARILSVAKDRGLITVNQCENGGRLYKSNRTEIIWTAADIEMFCEKASEELKFASAAGIMDRPTDEGTFASLHGPLTTAHITFGCGRARVVAESQFQLARFLRSRWIELRPLAVRQLTYCAQLAVPALGPRMVLGDRGAKLTNAQVLRPAFIFTTFAEPL